MVQISSETNSNDINLNQNIKTLIMSTYLQNKEVLYPKTSLARHIKPISSLVTTLQYIQYCMFEQQVETPTRYRIPAQQPIRFICIKTPDHEIISETIAVFSISS